MRRFSFGGHSASPVSPLTPWDNSPTLSAPPANERSPSTPSTPTFKRMFGRRGLYGNKMKPENIAPTPVEEAPVPPPFMSNSVAVRLSKRAAMLDKRQNVHFRHSSQPLTQLEHQHSAQQQTPATAQHHAHSSAQFIARPKAQDIPQQSVEDPNEYSTQDPLRYLPQFERLRRPQQVVGPPTLQIPQQQPLGLAELEGTTPRLAELEGDRPRMAELEGDTPSQTLEAIPARVIPAGTVKTVQVKARRFSQKLFPSLRPDKTQYSVECSNAAAEVARAETDAREKKFVANHISAFRAYEKKAPLELDGELSAHAQHHADNLPSRAYPTTVPPGPSFYFPTPECDVPKPDSVTTVASPLDRCSVVARIVSDSGLGAMACVERWYSGKHKSHRNPIDPERHQEDCPCRLNAVYETIMYEGYTKIGVGRATEGSSVWVVELAP